ncbi:helix-turn-helix domain-containing protein [Metabacillus sp. 84]|uniref:helix-turn-helix domain-containing protein n=1 Tax=Metabacillus sp. 84 TaxID=3404705 RepID=UPI003CE7D497
MNAASKLKIYIKDKGLKYGFVADRAGIDQKKFSKLINGQQRLTVEDLENICKKGLSVNPSIFLD